jgi:hypothetical protein
MKRLFIIFFFFSRTLAAQDDLDRNLILSGYIEAYYSYDFNQPENNLRPDFLYNFNRHNEFSINLALVKASFQNDRVRANLALMAGTYAQYNLADEPAWAKFINEASLGIKLHEKLWVDVGVMPSYIGFESWYGMDCMNLTRSIMAENSPYFFTGGKVTYTPHPKWEIQLWLTNGWQNIVRNENNKSLGIGTGIKFIPSANFTFNYSNYFGNENPQPVRLNRFFNNFYLLHEKGKWATIFGVDFGIQENFSKKTDSWFGFIGSISRELGEKFTLAGRAEYYSDPNAIILTDGLKVSGFSANVDFSIREGALFRIEARRFISPEDSFRLPDGNFGRQNTALTTSLALRF